MKSVDDKRPLPNTESLFDKLDRAQYFSSLGLAKGFHQFLMDEKDIERLQLQCREDILNILERRFG